MSQSVITIAVSGSRSSGIPCHTQALVRSAGCLDYVSMNTLYGQDIRGLLASEHMSYVGREAFTVQEAIVSSREP